MAHGIKDIFRSKYFNPFVEREYKNQLVSRSGKCQKRFNFWKYCEGICDRNGMIENWQCTDFSEYPNAGRAWKTSTPTGIVLSRIWLISLIFVNFVSLFFITKNGKQIRTCFAAISIFGFTLLTNSYVMGHTKWIKSICYGKCTKCSNMTRYSL